jgi:peptidylprolyl isomerase
MMSKAYTSFIFGSALFLGTLGAAETNNKDLKEAPQVTPAQEQDEIRKLSESFGHFIGRNLNTPGIKFDLNLLIKGIREGAEGKPAPMDEAEYEQLLNKHLAKAYLEVSNNNLKTANDFMTINGKKSGVIELEKGKLQYQVLEKGNGEIVKDNSTPQIHYTGKYSDGKIFDDSRQRGAPISIPIQGTIPGFRKGIVGMKEGESRRLFIHPDLGYGTSGNLPPNSLLVFDIEVLKADTPKTGSNQDSNPEEDQLEDEELSRDQLNSDDQDDVDTDDEDFQLPQW